MAPQLTIQIVGWNSARALPPALASLQTIPQDAAVIRYIDNGSSDDSVAVVRRLLPTADVVLLGRNTGFAGGHNAGFQRCTTELVMVHNPDLVIDWAGVQRICWAFQDARLAAAQGMLYQSAEKKIIDSAGVQLTRTLNGYDRGTGTVDTGQFDQSEMLTAVTGAAGIYRLAAIWAVAYNQHEIFDEDFFAYKEDVDLGWRLTRAGWKVMYVPVVMGVHSRSLKPGHFWRRRGDLRTRYSLRNWVWLIVKNAGAGDIVRHEIFIAARLATFGLISLFTWRLLPVWPEIFRGLPRIVAKRHEA